MAVPWLRLLDAAFGVTDLVRMRRRASDDPSHQLEAGGRTLGGLETRLAGVVVAALKEAFDRDSHRLELEREQREAERQRAERALRLELIRQAADREIGRLRLLAALAVTTWIGTVFFAGRVAGAGPRTLLGAGWTLLLAALAMSFTAQSRLAREMDRAMNDSLLSAGHGASSGSAGTLAPWFIVAGLALIGVAILFTTGLS